MLKCTRLCAGVCEHKHDAVCLLETRKTTTDTPTNISPQDLRDPATVLWVPYLDNADCSSVHPTGALPCTGMMFPTQHSVISGRPKGSSRRHLRVGPRHESRRRASHQFAAS